MLFMIRECLKLTIVNSQDPEVSCPDDCDSKLLDREIKEVSVVVSTYVRVFLL